MPGLSLWFGPWFSWLFQESRAVAASRRLHKKAKVPAVEATGSFMSDPRGLFVLVIHWTGLVVSGFDRRRRIGDGMGYYVTTRGGCPPAIFERIFRSSGRGSRIGGDTAHVRLEAFILPPSVPTAHKAREVHRLVIMVRGPSAID